jgi:acyl-CoA synthetase (AMP-forming)/AMP-acid ligase II
MISHANLIANANALRSLCDLSPGNWVVSWLPLFHDMGLMGGMLQPLFAGASCALMPPAAFVLRPRRWLALIDRLRAFACAAPNFAFDLCVERITEADREGLDLSCWQVALCGAEPVRAETLARFAAAFGPAGFRAETLSPCYGLAEATLAVTGARPGVRPRLLDVDAEMLRTGRVRSARRGAPGGRRTLVGCGAPLPGISLAIVDPATGERAPPGQTGEIWIAGDQVSIGYWRDPEASARRMGAALADAPGLRWLCSGDIGFQEGEDLFVLGRIDDMILVRGRNHAPQDIEHTVEKSGCALRPNSTVAFLGAGAASDGIVVVAEVNQRAAAEGPAILRAVRAAVAAEHGLELVGLALLKPNGLARTTSGKVRRAPTAAAWRDGSLPVLFRWEARPAKADLPPRPDGPADAGLILRWLTARCAQALGLDEASMDADALVVDLGLGSQQALVIASDLSDWLGRPVAPTILIEEGLTLALLAQRQAGRAVPGEEVRPVALVDQPEGRA